MKDCVQVTKRCLCNVYPSRSAAFPRYEISSGLRCALQLSLRAVRGWRIFSGGYVLCFTGTRLRSLCLLILFFRCWAPDFHPFCSRLSVITIHTNSRIQSFSWCSVIRLTMLPCANLWLRFSLPNEKMNLAEPTTIFWVSLTPSCASEVMSSGKGKEEDIQ